MYLGGCGRLCKIIRRTWVPHDLWPLEASSMDVKEGKQKSNVKQNCVSTRWYHSIVTSLLYLPANVSRENPEIRTH